MRAGWWWLAGAAWFGGVAVLVSVVVTWPIDRIGQATVGGTAALIGAMVGEWVDEVRR